MRFFSGFALRDEAALLGVAPKSGDYVVAGFSYGAIKAARYALQTRERVDTLQLLSPAFFQEQNERFKRLQTSAYAKDPEGYLSRFLINCFAPLEPRAVAIADHSAGQLEELLHFVWTPELLEAIAAKGTRIEVFLGGLDRIVDAEKARRFFTPYATVTLINRANHFLQEQS